MKRIVYCLLCSFWLLFLSKTAYAQFSPPTQIQVSMYVLNQDGSSTGNLCLTNGSEYRFGCTNDPTRSFPLANPATVSIDGIFTSPYNRYLLDVVPKEIGVTASSRGNKPISTVKAMAVAARTYAYHRSYYNITLYNSVTSQVFIPYYYDSLSAEQKQTVNDAVAGIYYLAETGSTYPAETLHGADNGARTSQGNRPYLKNVDDPVSSAYGISDGTTLGGLSHKGASRWGFGHQSSKGPAFENSSQYPHDIDGNGNFWGVQWNRAEQILFHYYTGVDLRLVNGLNTNLVSQPDRWNPLKIENLPGSISSGGSFQVNVQVQNVGIYDWSCNSTISAYHLVYHWERPGALSSSYNELTNLCNTSKGDPSPTGNGLTVNVPSWNSGAYVLKFDMQKTIPAGSITVHSYFQNGPNSWPTYDVNYCVGGACTAYSRFMPVITYNCSGNCPIPSQ